MKKFRIISDDPSFDVTKREFVSQTYAEKICNGMNEINGQECFKVVEIEEKDEDATKQEKID